MLKRMHAPPATKPSSADMLHVGQNRLLEMIIEGVPLRDILAELCRLMESVVPAMHCTILLVDASGRTLRSFVAPSVAPEFSAAVDGLLVAEGYGSCGTAAARKESVFTPDVRTDP